MKVLVINTNAIFSESEKLVKQVQSIISQNVEIVVGNLSDAVSHNNWDFVVIESSTMIVGQEQYYVDTIHQKNKNAKVYVKQGNKIVELQQSVYTETVIY